MRAEYDRSRHLNNRTSVGRFVDGDSSPVTIGPNSKQDAEDS